MNLTTYLKPPKPKTVDPQLIAGLRARVRLSPTQFARKLLVTRMTVWRWENGKSKPSDVHLRQMYQLWGFSFGVQAKEDK